MNPTTQLCPAQRTAIEAVTRILPAADIVALRGKVGRGKSLLLDYLQREHDGRIVRLGDFFEHLAGSHPLAIEESFYAVLSAAMRDHPLVLVDDFHLATAVLSGCHFYPRAGLLATPLMILASYAVSEGKKLILATDTQLPDPLDERCYTVAIEQFQPADYRHFCDAYLGPRPASQLDLEKIYRFAPKLNGHQLRAAGRWFSQNGGVDTDAFIEYLRSQRMASNVELGEVAQVDLHELRGVDDVIRQLEAHIVVPLEHDELAKELDLEPKRGVLLVGPPGTGKTTVGRALAHRLRGKFFLIDGTFISGTRDFYNKIHWVFEAAKENAPAVIFIDGVLSARLHESFWLSCYRCCFPRH